MPQLACFLRPAASDAILVVGVGSDQSGGVRVDAEDAGFGDHRRCVSDRLDHWLGFSRRINRPADASGERLFGRGGAEAGQPLRGGLDAVGGFQGLDPLGDFIGGR